jgi:SapC
MILYMFKSLVPVNKARHEGKKIKQVEGFGFAADFHIASIMVHEFARAASLYPVVFLEDKEQDSFRPVVLMGMDAGENLFVGADGKWQASYVPAIIRRYPFALASAGEEGKFTVCIDEGSDLISDTEGLPLFNEQGEPAEALENVKRYLGELQQMDAFTNEFCKYMVAHNMLTPLNMRVQQADQVKNINGCYVINEERLNGLSVDGFMDLRDKRYLPAVYAHLLSLAQIERLMTLKDERLATLASAA